MLFNYPKETIKHFNSWVLSPINELAPPGHLFPRSASNSITMKREIENYLSENYPVLTISQRCAELFLLKILRLAETLFSLYLLKNNYFRSMVMEAPTKVSSYNESEETSNKK